MSKSLERVRGSLIGATVHALRRVLLLGKAPHVEVILYGKANCPLCDEAERRVRRVAKRLPLRLRKVDITEDPDLLAAYREQIPVVRIAGEVLFAGKVSELRVERAVRSALTKGGL